MERAHDLANSALLNKSSSQSSSGGSGNEPPQKLPLSAQLLDELWVMMASRYGHTWLSQFGPSPDGYAGDEWAKTLSGMNKDRIMQGMDADQIRGGEWPPSSTQFLSMCHRIPEFSVVRIELNGRNTTRTPFGQLVWNKLDGFNYKQLAADKADRLLRDAYDAARIHVLEGGALPYPPEHLIEYTPQRKREGNYTPAIAHEEMTKIAKALGMKS